jgi:hypothetical protein
LFASTKEFVGFVHSAAVATVLRLVRYRFGMLAPLSKHDKKSSPLRIDNGAEFWQIAFVIVDELFVGPVRVAKIVYCPASV